MTILNIEGKILARWGGEKKHVLDYLSNLPGDYISYRHLISDCLKAPGKIVDGHDCCVDSKGDLYIGEAAAGQRLTKYIRKK
jgi:hypothetical protein